VTGTRVLWHDPCGRRPEPPPGPVAVNRAADLAADGEADAKRLAAARGAAALGVFRRVAPGLKDETGRHPFMAGASDAQEFPASFQTQHGCGFDAERHGQAGQPRPATPSRGKTLPPLGATVGKNPAAANGCHAAAESMPALADELAWLKGTLHGLSPTNNEPAVYGFACVKSTPVAAMRTALKPGPGGGFFHRPGRLDDAVIKFTHIILTAGMRFKHRFGLPNRGVLPLITRNGRISSIFRQNRKHKGLPPP